MQAQCKPTTIDAIKYDTCWFGCPQESTGRSHSVYGIVIHSLNNANVSALRNSMLANSVPATVQSGMTSAHYIVGLTLESFVDKDDIAWAADYKCNFDVAPNIPPPDEGYPGWSGFPPGVHIAENCIHVVVNIDMPLTTYYDSLVRLVKYLGEIYSIPMDPFHVGHYREITRNSNLKSIAIPNLFDNVEQLCERCCESVDELTPANEMIGIHGIDVYGCEAITPVPEGGSAHITGDGCIEVEGGTVRFIVDPSECNALSCDEEGIFSPYPSYSAHTLSFWTNFVSDDEFSVSGSLNNRNQGVWHDEFFSGGISEFEEITNPSCLDGFLDLSLYQSYTLQIDGSGHMAHRYSFTIDGGLSWRPYSITHLYGYKNTYSGGMSLDRVHSQLGDTKRWFIPILSAQTLSLGTRVEVGVTQSVAMTTCYEMSGFHRVSATLHHYPPP